VMGRLCAGTLVALTLSCHAGQTSAVYRAESGELKIGPPAGKRVQRLASVLLGAESVLAALQLHEAASGKGLQISTIDISSPNCIRIVLVGGVKCSIAWRDMGKDTKPSAIDLASRLDRIAAILKASQGSPMATIDVTDSAVER
jgi:hypothetical protein